MKTAADWASGALAKFDATVESEGAMVAAEDLLRMLQRIAADDPLPKLAAEAAEWMVGNYEFADGDTDAAVELVKRLAAYHKTNGPGEAPPGQFQSPERTSPAPTFNTDEGEE